VFARDQRDFAVAHALLRETLALHSGIPAHEWVFSSGPHGKPVLDARLAARTGLSFNLAHTQGLVACAVMRNAEIGIDVERINQRIDVLTLARHYFASPEVGALESCAEAQRYTQFTELWTLKEAYLKATGVGLSHSLNEFWFVFDGPASLRFDSMCGAQQTGWRFAVFAPPGGYRLAVAVRMSTGAMRSFAMRAGQVDDGQPIAVIKPIRTSRE
jgi:4'-phosphopantetheinyl transferase